MIRWISDKLFGNKKESEKDKDRRLSPSFLLEQSVAYSAFLSNEKGNGEKISFEEFLRRQNLTHF